MNLVDRGKSLSDGTVVSLQDRYEMKTPSSQVPSSIPRDFSHQFYWWKSSFTTGNITTSLTVNVTNQFQVTASLWNDFPNFAAIFDQYCIVAVAFRFIPLNSLASAGSPGILCTVIDHDDTTALSSTGAAQEYSTLLETTQLQGQTRIVFPRIAVAAYSSSFVSFANQRSWIDCSSSTVQHYGLKSLMTPSTTATYSYAVEVDGWFLFRDNH